MTRPKFKFLVHARVVDPDGVVGIVIEQKVFGTDPARDLAYRVQYTDGGHRVWVEAGLEPAPVSPAPPRPIVIPPLGAGDVVRLRCGTGPRMVIVAIDQGEAEVMWHTPGDDFQTARFRTVALERVSD